MLNVGGSELETQTAPLPLPLPQPDGPRNDFLNELTTANTGSLPSSLSAALAATLETASQTLAASHECVVESQDLRDSIEGTSLPTATPPSLTSSSSTLPTLMDYRAADLAERQRIILAIKARFPVLAGLPADQDKALLAAFDSPEKSHALLSNMLLGMILPLEDKHAGQLVSMFLERSHEDIWDLIESPALLSAKVAEAVKRRLLAGTLVYQPGPRSGGRRAWVQDWWVGVADCDWPLANVPGHACVISVRSETVPEHVGPFGVLSVGPSLVCN